MLGLFFVILSAALVFCLSSNRNAVLAIFAIGFLQDPFRKLIPGEPIYFIVTVGLVFAVVFLSTLQKKGLSGIKEPFVAWTNELRRPLSFFLIILLLQFIHSLLAYGSAVISLIGLLSYTAPFFAIVVGYFIVDSDIHIRAVMKYHIIVGVILALTILLSFSGVDYQIFEEVGSGLKIYDQGTVLRSFSGFMRTGEIASWHVATSCCFIFILYLTTNKKPPALLIVALLILMVVAIALTGRRKMLMLLSLFGVLYGLAFSFYTRKLSFNYVFSAAIVVFSIWVSVQFLSGNDDNVKNYIARGASVYQSASARAIDLGFQPIRWAYNRVGLLGGGLGIASQGSHLFNVSNIAGGSGEGGLGKIMVELGLPGLIAALWVFFAFAKYINSSLILSAQKRVPRHFMPFMLGIACLLLVNMMTFSVASQLYGDMFILIIIGLLAGFLFALPKLVVRAMSDNIALRQSSHVTAFKSHPI